MEITLALARMSSAQSSPPLATVFGGSGFIGRHVVQRLAAAGWRIRVATRDPEGATFLRPRGDVGQVEPVFADLTKEFTVQAAVERADLVINLVGILFERGRQRFTALQGEGATRIAAAAKAGGTRRLIHVSALGADVGSPSAYARSKAEGEEGVFAAFPDAVIFRPSVVFGPEDDFFNRFAALSNFAPFLPVFVSDGFRLRGLSLDLFGSGGTKFQPVYVGDLADGIMAALNSDQAGKIFEATGPKIYSFKQLMELTLRAIDRKRPLIPLPMAVAKLQAAFLQLLPKPPLTLDQVKLLAQDNIATGTLPGLHDLGIHAQDAEAIVPTYLARYKNPYVFDRLR
jgi:NADH dehydrogenase